MMMEAKYLALTLVVVGALLIFSAYKMDGGSIPGQILLGILGAICIVIGVAIFVVKLFMAL